MKTIYMGTPEFAVPGLEALYKSGHEIGYVVTQPDKARDRGKKVQFTPVKEKAQELSIEVLQPEKIKGNEEFLQKLKGYAPDLIVVAAYGKLLPPEIIHLPRLGCVNIHASLLPRFRGAAPIQRSIMEGDEYTGITLMYMEEGLDTGDMIAKKQTPILRKTAAELHDELALLGGELLSEQLTNIESGNIVREKQEDSLSTYAPMIFKKDGELDFSKDPVVLERLIRGMDSWPGAYTEYKEQMMKVWGAEPLEKVSGEPYGTILSVTKKGLEVSAGGKTLLITVIQMPGKKRVSVEDYLKGNKIEVHEVLGGKNRD
ncbi:methionyl-tRNA formyltransferase [Clostridium aminobutyricum]|uniref:Methionyl-tRNA formyltransferase n=1 Tax=Clostridium aminobutyricum TaxID=33953 RepID=A0A939IGJ8_CLOAM|nr:methionyl-tRNA formyltransferase [Clostridium aminobutyricum]MBN7772047.1 methionyl-tRNA formyltransferase [Clostridium aminobutyricum]